jgi:putative ABC transport system ATP-binding protein
LQVFRSAAPVGENEKPLIQMRGLVKNYRTAAGEFPALRGIDLDVQTGEFIGILGKSGAGKTTLINLLTAVDHCSAGEIWVDGVAVHKMTENQAAAWRGRNLGVVYQSFQLMPTLSLLRNIMLPMDFSRKYRRTSSPQYAMQLLRQVELEGHAHKLPSAISGGQQQRVAIARALANDPPIIVADEPTGRLDSVTAETIFQVFESLVNTQGKTVIMVTHDTTFVERFSRIIWLADGQVSSQPQFGMI